MLSGAEKVAILLMALSTEVASQIVNSLDEEEIREVSHTMANLGTIESEIVERVILEFINDINSSLGFVGNAKNTERFLRKTLEREKLDGVIKEVHNLSISNVWEKLSNLSDQVIADFLKSEYPQTAAVVISKLSSSQAAKVLSVLNKEYAFEVIKRMLAIEDVKREALDKLEKSLQGQLASGMNKVHYNNNKVVAEIFNNFDPNSEKNFMSMLESYNQDAALGIRRFMFTFKDLASIDVNGIQALLKVADKSKLALALKEAPEDVQQAFLRGMSQRASKLLIEEVESIGSVRAKDIQEAQVSILNITKDLIAKGVVKFDQNGSN